MPFQPGNNANPGGKPKQKPFRDALLLAMNEDEDAPPRRKTKLDKVVAALLAKASEAGDIPAIKEIMDRVDGKVPQAVIGDKDEDGIQIDGLALLLAAIDGKTRTV